MIKLISLKNFKCFQQAKVPFRCLTVLSGLNGMGKSTVIQGLLLLRQSYDQGLLQKQGIALNGELVRIGTGHDALFEGAAEDLIGFGITTAEDSFASWDFSYNRESDVMELKSVPVSDDFYAKTSLFGPSVRYLKAERVGPRLSFETSDYAVRQLRQLGSQGENAAHFLSVFKDEPVEEQLLYPQSFSRKLGEQVIAWMGEVSPGVQVNVVPHPDMDVVSTQWSFKSGRHDSSPYRSTNVGFGLSYTLPVVLALLVSKPGHLVIIENPEAHLHPRGQRQLGELAARAAMAGAQVIIETHSDHVINGIRLAVYSNLIPAEDVQFHFFRRVPSGISAPRTEIVSPKIDEDGRLDQWPDGFFDEWDKALEVLLRPKEGH